MILLFSAFTLFYCGLLLSFRLGLSRLSRPQPHSPQFLSVIVAARNEAENLPQLLPRLLAQTHPHFEIIVADDRSDDSTPEILAEFSARDPRLRFVRVNDIRPELVGKKRALTEAIAIARGEILVFTDADALPEPSWLNAVDAHFNDDVDYLFGPSPLLIEAGPVFRYLKSCERAAHHAFSAGALGWGWGVSCSAANMAYRKRLFDEVGGFAGIGHIPSGDDDLMLQKLAPQARKMTYMFTPDSVLPVLERGHRRDRLERETRRASKWRYYPASVKIVSGAVFLYYALLIVDCGLWCGGAFPGVWLLWGLAAKTGTEFLLVGEYMTRLRQERKLWGLPFFLVAYLPYFLYFGIRGTLMRYRWR